MADCSKYSTQLAAETNALKQAQNTYNDLKSRVNNIQTVDQGDRLDDLLGDLTGQFQFIEGQFVNILEDAQRDGCSQQAAQAKQSAAIARNFAGSSYSSQQTAKSKTGDLRKEEQASREAASKQNNAGTGTPGTAGQTTTTTTETSISTSTRTGSTSPKPVTEPGTTPSDGLSEVSVTGKRNPATVTEPTSGDALEEVSVTGKRATDPNTNTGLQGQKQNTRAQATIQDTTNFEQIKDWRVRLRLSPGADYLYKAPEGQRGILEPLNETDGVVFPYTPVINVSYAANYDQLNPTHSNYKILQYTNSSVDGVSLSCDFTAQDTREANYLLAVIHFFRSVTKMFYGQDQNPKPGTPPPLVYLFGLGEFQFNAHPLVITNFNYALPNDVDYIRAGAVTANPGVSRQPSKTTSPSSSSALDRLKQGAAQIGSNFIKNILPGGVSGPATFTPSGFNAVTPAGTEEPTYVPTKINLQIQCMPVISRNEISNNFSLKDYAQGKLLRGTQRAGGGFW